MTALFPITTAVCFDWREEKITSGQCKPNLLTQLALVWDVISKNF